LSGLSKQVTEKEITIKIIKTKKRKKKQQRTLMVFSKMMDEWD
jgi:hypothetical protein